jgi:hypothetical protein
MNLVLALPDQPVKKLKTVGKVVRVASATGSGSDGVSQGMGVEFAHSPGEELILRKFILDAIDHSITVNFSWLPSCPSRSDSDRMSSHSTLCKWWLKEIIRKAGQYNKVTVELVLALVILVLITLAFL